MITRKEIFAAMLILIIAISTGCERDDFSWGRKIGRITYSGNVVFLGIKELDLLEEITPTRLVFSEKKGEIEKITEKSILVIGVSEKTPYGSLRRVSGFRPNGPGIEFTTSDAVLEDAIKEGTIHFQKKLLEKDFTMKSKLDGILLKVNDKSFEGLAVTLQNFGIFNEGETHAWLNGAIGITPEIEITINIAFNEIKDVTLITTLSKIDEITVSSDGGFGGREETNVAEFIHAPVVIDSLVFVPEILISCGYNGTVAGEVSSGVRQDRTITSGISYTGSKWVEEPLTHNESFDFITPQITDNSELEIFSGPEIVIKLFGVPVQTIKATGYFSLDAEENRAPFWKLLVGSEGHNIVHSGITGLREEHLVDMGIEPSEIGNAGKK